MCSTVDVRGDMRVFSQVVDKISLFPFSGYKSVLGTSYDSACACTLYSTMIRMVAALKSLKNDCNINKSRSFKQYGRTDRQTDTLCCNVSK
jgi:hypothetical protein